MLEKTSYLLLVCLVSVASGSQCMGPEMSFFNVLYGQRRTNVTLLTNKTADSDLECIVLCRNLGIDVCVSANFNEGSKMCETHKYREEDGTCVTVIGQQQWLYMYTNDQFGPPQKANITALNSTSENITMYWTGGDNGCYKQSFMVEYKLVSANSWTVAESNIADTGSSMEHTILSLEATANYEVRINSTTTRKGNLNTVISETRNITTLEGPKCSTYMLGSGQAPDTIADSAILASSWYSQPSDVAHSPKRVRLCYQNDGGGNGGWSAQHNNANQWMRFDLGEVECVRGIAMRSRINSDQRITSFSITYGDTVNTMAQYTTAKSATVFTGNTGSTNTFSINKLEPRFYARYVQINIVAWSSHVSMRAAVIPCCMATIQSGTKLCTSDSSTYGITFYSP